MGTQLVNILSQFPDEIANKMPEAALDTFSKADSIINNPTYERIGVSISGGGDSDIMLDILHRVDVDKKCRYVFFNTGIEYRATLEHLDYLEERYGIEIERVKPKRTIPMSCKEFGQPFISKDVSAKIHSLQMAGFKWEDEPLSELEKKYKGCHSALEWWTGERYVNGEKVTRFTIGMHKWLKEFLIENPPWFSIANNCCDGTKKLPAHHYAKDNHIDVMCVGLRKAEGGTRAVAYTNCFSYICKYHVYQYRPLFWWMEDDCTAYRELMGIQRSRCYTEYGMKRTGCAGCPYDRWIFQSLESVKDAEPEMVRIANLVFKDAYEYTKMFREYQTAHGIYEAQKAGVKNKGRKKK